MLQNYRGLLLTLGLIFMTLTSVGCLSNRLNLADTGYVKIVKQDSKYVHFSSAFVYQEHDKVVIRGSVRRTYFSPPGIYRGHIDIEVSDANGNVLKQISTRTFPLDIPHRGTRRSSFSTECQMILTEGATVNMRYHRGSRC